MKKLPAYQMIYQDLEKKIRNGFWKDGQQLPTEFELSEQYQVSRITVRHALQLLVEKGSILRLQGKGSIVTKKLKSSGVIAVAINDFGPFFGEEFIKSVIMHAEKEGYSVILQTCYYSHQQENTVLLRLLDANIAGLIFVPLYGSKNVSPELKKVADRLPLVFADRKIDGLDAPLVCTDNISATEELCRRLIHIGHRRIGFVSSNTDSTVVRDRLKGYVNALTTSGITIDESLKLTTLRSVLPGMATSSAREDDIAAIQQYFLQNPDIHAVVAHTYSAAELVYLAAQRAKLRIPQDCAIVCFDAMHDVIPGPGFFAHMKQNEYEMGEEAVKALLSLIRHKPVRKLNFVNAIFQDGKSYVY